MASFRYALLVLVATSSFVPVIASGQNQWTVKVVTVASVPVGQCSALVLEIRDVETRDVPRNPNGDRVTVADFDVTMSGAPVAPEYTDAYHVRACVCQGATVGSSATVTAVYPASVLPVSTRVAGVSAKGSETFLIGKPDNKVDPLACTKPTVAPRSAVVIAAMKQTVASTTTRTTAPLAPAPIPIPVTTAPTPLSVPSAPRLPGGTATAVSGAPISSGTPGTKVATAPSPPSAPLPGSALPTATSAGKIGVVPSPPSPALVPVNPMGFVAVQTGPDRVQLSWEPVETASYYVLFGPGLTEGGVKVPATGFVSSSDGPVKLVQFTATVVPAGLQQWKIASYYEPGPVSTAASAFPIAILNVIGPVVAINPTGFSAVQTGAGLVKLSWQPVTGATYYIVRGPGLPSGEIKLQSNSVAGATAVGTASINQSLQVTANAVPIGIQNWTVASYFDPGPVSTAASEFAKASLSVAPPTNPSAFTATQLAGRQVKFSWQEVPGASYYMLMGTGLPSGGTRVTLEPGGYVSTQTGSVPLVTFTANSIPSGSGVWQVGSFFEPGPISSPVSAFTRVALTVVEPTNPAGFTAAQIGSGQVRLSWLPVSGVSFYVVTGSGLPFEGARIGTAVSGDLTKLAKVEFAVSGVPTGKGTWQVGSYFDPGAISSPTELFSETSLNVAAPLNPVGLSAVQIGAGQVKITWQLVSGASYYLVMGAGLPPAGTKVIVDGTNTGPAIIPTGGLIATGVPSGLWTWKVGSYFEPGGLSTPSSEFPTVALNVIPPVNPSGLTAVQTAVGQVRLSWQQVEGAAYYIVTGTGIPPAGTKVVAAVGASNTTGVLATVGLTVSGLPLGPGTWQVGSYFEPGPVASAADAFSKVSLNVTAPTK